MTTFTSLLSVQLILAIVIPIAVVYSDVLPMVINTWPVPNATQAAWNSLLSGGSAVDAVVAGCSECEAEQCRGAVGGGRKPDESGETTLDAMIMDGATMDVGAVGCLRRVKTAIKVARAVMDYTDHTLLVGDLATAFALEMNFVEANLTSNKSIETWSKWKAAKCQPNFRENVHPNPKENCGPYRPLPNAQKKFLKGANSARDYTLSKDNHDTIGMLAIDASGNIGAGTSTNGLSHKIPGRVGDSPIMGAGSYAENGKGAAAVTGNGDIMMRFLPSYNAVMQMGNGFSPTAAVQNAMKPIIRYYPSFSGAMIAVNKYGEYGATCHGYRNWTYCLANPVFNRVITETITCM